MSQIPSEPDRVATAAPATSGRDAAQGRTGSRTFIILITSIVLVVVAFIVAYAMHGRGLSSHQGYGGSSGVKGPAAQSFHAPAEAAPKQNAPTTETAPGTH